MLTSFGQNFVLFVGSQENLRSEAWDIVSAFLKAVVLLDSSGYTSNDESSVDTDFAGNMLMMIAGFGVVLSTVVVYSLMRHFLRWQDEATTYIVLKQCPQ